MPNQSLAELFEVYRSNVFPAMLDVLSEDLGVSSCSLSQIGIGFNPEQHSWILPERDDQGEIIGLIQRLPNRSKRMIKGSKRGLTYILNSKSQRGARTYEPGKHNWTRVTSESPCPICGKPDWCLISSNNPIKPGAVLCSRISAGSRKTFEGCGFLHILTKEGEISKNIQNPLSASNYPVIVVEGQSDVAAATDLGFVSIGRPSAQGKSKMLIKLLQGREVIIVGENDAGAGREGMEAVAHILQDICPTVIRVMPPEGVKDFREWYKQGLSLETFLKYCQEHGETGGNPNILEDGIAHNIADVWLKKEKMEDGHYLLRNYRGQWVQYFNNRYEAIDTNNIRGELYKFLEKKSYPRINAKGEIVVIPYEPTRSKISDILDATNQWCPISDDPPIWLDEKKHPNPRDLIVFQNGILDVQEYIQGNIIFHDPSPAFFSFNVLPYDFNPDLESKMWNEFLEDIYSCDKSKIRLLAQWCGYNLVPDMTYEKLMFFVGRPRSGKGTVLNTMAAMLGEDQCCSTSFQSLASSFGYQPLVGKLAVLLGDAKIPKQREAEAAFEKILQITGGDAVSINRKNLIELPHVHLKCRFTAAMNDLPNIPDHSQALEPRLNIISFGNSYVGREDRTLKWRLKQEAQAGKLINFALRGLKDLRTEKEFVFPKTSVELVGQLRELTTPVVCFIEDCCKYPEPIDPPDEFYILKDQLYEAWQHWCSERGYKPGLREQFSQWFITSCPTVSTKRVMFKGRRRYIFQGVRLQKWVYQDYLGRPE